MEKYNNTKKIYIVGIGMEGMDTLTIKGKNVIKKAEVIIGAKRMLESVSYLAGDNCKKYFSSYHSSEIKDFIEKNESKTFAVLMSGDCGFYSGCKKLLEELNKCDYDVQIVSGISSVTYFSNLLGESYEDMNIVSLHGLDGNVALEVKYNRKTFFLLGGNISPYDICNKLVQYGMGDVKVFVGENLGMKEAKIYKSIAKEFDYKYISKLCVMICINDNYEIARETGISDDKFLRGNVPMTKAEVRAACISKLRLCKSDVCWDIGCGTGSVSIEMAIQANKGKVYAIDKNKEAVQLTLNNSKNFGCDNIICREMDAENVKDLPNPDKVFIGGSSGKIKNIIAAALEKNPECTFVITAVSLETIEVVTRVFEEFERNIDVVMISVTRTKKIGDHTMLNGLNPVFIITSRL